MHGLDGVRPFNHLENRTEIDFATYEKLHKRSLTQPLTEAKGARLVKIETEGNLYGYRRYAIA
jgi:3-hydroxy-3-methylglutaryl CoA synthase